MISLKSKRGAFFLVSVLLTVLCIAFIFSNSLKDGPASAEQSGTALGFASSLLSSLGLDNDSFNMDMLHKFIRKAAHIAEFSLLGALISLDLALVLGLGTSDTVRRSVKLLVPALPLGLLVAVVDELLQLSSVGRSAQVSDVLIDLIGILLGTLFIWLIFIVCRAARNKKA